MYFSFEEMREISFCITFVDPQGKRLNSFADF